LQGDDAGAEVLVDFADDVVEEGFVLLVGDAVVEGDVDGVVGAGIVLGFGPVVFKPACAGEEDLGLVLVEGDRHDAVGGEEGFFYAVAVVHVDVDVEDPGVAAEELEDG